MLKMILLLSININKDSFGPATIHDDVSTKYFLLNCSSIYN